MRSETIEEMKKKKRKDKAVFNFTTSDRTPCYFSDYTNLMRLTPDIYTRKLSFDKTKKEQEKMLKKIEELENRFEGKRGRLKDDNRKK